MQELVFLALFVNFSLSFLIIFFTSNTYAKKFGVAVFFSGIWTLTNIIFQISNTYHIVFAVALFSYTSATVLLFFLNIFIFDYYKYSYFNFLKISRRIVIFTFYVSLILPYLGDLILKDVDIQSRSIVNGEFNFLLYLTYIILILSIFSNLLFIFSKRHNSRKEIIGISGSLFITISVSLLTNIILPANNLYQFVIFGPIVSLVFLFYVSYAILRYQFLDIRVFLGKIVYYLLAAAIAYVAFYISFIFDLIVFGDPFAPGAFIVGIFIAIGFVVLFNAFNKFLINNVTSKLISPDYNPDEEVSRFNNQINKILNENTIKTILFNTLNRTIKPLKLEMTTTQDIEKNKDLVNISKINSAIGEIIIQVEQIENEYPKILNEFKEEVYKIIDYLKKHDFAMLISIGESKEMYGILKIGKKPSGFSFNSVETKFIKSLVDLASLSLNRAKLYTEVSEFNESLQIKIAEATREIQTKNAQLQETLNFQRDMMDIMGHELRTPLGTARNAILGIRTLQKAGKLTDTQISKMLDIAEDHLKREVELVETILTSTKIDNAKVNMDMIDVSLTKILQLTKESHEHLATKKQLSLEVEFPKEDLYIYADKIRVQQVIDNIVNNALKYTRGGFVKIFTAFDQEYVYISIEDSGEGIPENEIPNLGKKFYRINTYLDSKGKLGEEEAQRRIVRPGGTGLGLYVVYEFTRLMGGEVKVSSKVGQGSTFSVKFKRSFPQKLGK